MKHGLARRQRADPEARKRADTGPPQGFLPQPVLASAFVPFLVAAPRPAPGGRYARETYIGVQYLRGLAAMLVVFFHVGILVRDSFPEIGDRLLLPAGAAGVDIFFPISGFVMFISSRALLRRLDGWKVFLERRLIRIVPLYWLTTTLKLATVLAVPTLASHTRLDPWHTLASYLFVSARNAEGNILPLVPVGWTLNYEMFFYALFAVALFLRKPLLPCVSLLLALAVAIDLASPVKTAPMAVLDPLILEFGAGVWIARLSLSGRRLTTTAAAVCLTLGLTAMIATGWLPDKLVEQWRLLLWGAPGALIVFAVVSLEPWLESCLESSLVERKWTLARRLGDASYSIYLSHDFTLLVLGNLAIAAGVHGPTGATVTFGLGVIASGAIGLAVHRRIERPVTQWLLSWSKSRSLIEWRNDHGESVSFAGAHHFVARHPVVHRPDDDSDGDGRRHARPYRL